MNKRLLSMFLTLCMIVSMLPVSAMAEEIHTTIGGSGEIISFAPLTETAKAVSLGTSIEDLELPETLTATVRTAVSPAEEPVRDSGSTDEGVISGDSAVATTSSAIEVKVDEPEATGETAEPEWEETTVEIPVTWDSPDYDPNTEGEYVFTLGMEGYTVSAPLPELMVTVGEMPPIAAARGLVTLLSATTYNIWVGGVQVTDDNKDDVLGAADGDGATVTYNSDTSTLTLNGATITEAHNGIWIDSTTSAYYGIYADTAQLKIEMVGSNTVIGKSQTGIASIGIYTGVALSLSGSGSLYVSGGTGIFSVGIYSAGSVTIEDGRVTAVSEDADQTSVAIVSNGDITISNAAVEASASTSASASYGMMAAEGFTINDGEVTAVGKTGLTAASATNPVTISGGTVTANGSQVGISGAVAVTSGTVTVKSDAKALDGSLTTSGYAGCTVTASTNKNGDGADTYNAANLATYKYLKVEPAAGVSEQFNLTPGGTYYFDLSGEKSNVGTVNTALPDTTLHYVPFTYAGTVNAYSLASAMAITQEQANASKSDRSLFVGDYNIGTSISWNSLNTANLIFGKTFDTNYTLRSLSVGSSKTGSAPGGSDNIGQPNTNEWDQILTKSGSTNNTTGWIKNWNSMLSWGQDTSAAVELSRAYRGGLVQQWDHISSSSVYPNLGFRPALEVLNPGTLGSGGLKAVTLNLNGGTLKGSTANINIICAGDNFTAPSGEGLTAPTGKVFDGWKDTSDTTYAVGATVPNTVAGLTAQWEALDTDVAQIGSTGYPTLQAAVDAVTEGQTIKLLNNITLANYVNIAGSRPSFTLDLNGKTLGYGGDNPTIRHSGSGTLTITDTASGGGGTVSTSGDNSNAIYNASTGNVTVSGGTVSASGNYSSAIDNSSTGTVTISGGTLSTSGEGTYAIYNERAGSVTVSGGTVTTSEGSAHAIYNFGTGNVTVSGGTIESTEGIAINNIDSGTISIPSGSAIIKGGVMAMNTPPDLSGYDKVKITASTTATDGSATSEITKTDIDTVTKVQAYKYLKFEPDTTSPAITSVYTTTTNGTYTMGDTLSFTVIFNENVIVTGEPSLSLTIGSQAKQAAYVSGSGTSALLFRYTVQVGDSDTNGITIDALNANGGTIKDSAGNNATLTFSPPATTGVLVDALAPIITGEPSPQTVNVGQGVTFSVTATGTGLTYRWQVNTGSSFEYITNGGVCSGANTSTLTITGATAEMNGYQYRAVVSDIHALVATSNTATLTVNAVPAKTVSVGSQSGTATAGTAGSLTYTVTTENIANGTYAVNVANLPAGVTVGNSGNVTVSGNSGTLTLTVADTAAAGTTDTLALTLDGTTSATFSIVIGETVLNLSLADVTLAAVTVGYGPSAYQPIVIANSGGAQATISNVTTDRPSVFSIHRGQDFVAAGSSINSWGIRSETGLTASTHTATITVTYDGGRTATATVSITVNAVGNHTVTFNPNGGTVSEASRSVASCTAVGTLPTPTRSGSYSFNGWYTAASGGTQISASTTVSANVTYYAHWTYTGGSGSGSSGGSSSNDNSSPVIVTPPAPDKPNSPTQGEIKVPGTADGKGNVTVNITDKTVTDAFEKSLTDAKKNGNEQNGITVVIHVDAGSKTGSNVTVNLPKTVQDTIIAKKIVNTIVVVDNPDIRVGMDLATVQEINKQAKSDVNITATRTDSGKLTAEAKKAIGSRPAFDLKVNYGSAKAVSSFGAGSVSVTIPYTLGANEKAGNVQAVYVDSKGKVHWLVNSVYDSVEKVLRFSTDHFSIYGIGYKQTNTAFTDIAGHWAKEDIEFVVSRGLFSGTSETKFNPNTAMTRGMFVTALGRLANTDVSGYAKSSFSDVKGDAYYMGYIEWASKNNIVNGVGNGKFAPDQSITREQMAVIMSNYAKTIGYTLPKVHVENTFADNGKISTYAKEAVRPMQMASVISGKNGNLFDPQGTTTRAEVSAVLRRFIDLAISSDTMQGWTMNDSGRWMYYENGKAVTGKKEIDGSTYTFDQYGVTADVPKNIRYTTYTVQKGDSFWSISRKLGCPMSELERLNNKSRFSLILPGDVLRVPEN